MSATSTSTNAMVRSVRSRSLRERRNSTSSLPALLVTAPSEMNDYASGNKETIQQLNVDYIDRRSGSTGARCEFRDCTLKPEISSHDDLKNAENDETIDRPENIGRQSSYTPHMQEKLQRKLKFYFMNPIEKWKAKGRFPWKLGIQLMKLFIVTSQLVIFAQYISEHVIRQEDTKLSLRHIFLEDWSSVRDLKTYPPSAGLYAVFSREKFYSHLNYAVRQYAALPERSIAPFSYNDPHGKITPIKFCKTFYKIGKVWSFNDSFMFDSTEKITCVNIEPELMNATFDMKTFLNHKNFSISFARLKHAELRFSIKSIFLKSLKPWDLPDCYTFTNAIKFENSNHDGLIAITMDSIFIRKICHGNIQYADKNQEEIILDDVLIAIVITICSISLALCSRAIYRAYQLQVETTTFFQKHLNTKLPFSDRSEFVNLWYITIILNDLLIIIGSILKLILSHFLTSTSSLYVTCTITLGIGNLLMWAGVLRYFGFFPKYNILILTLKNAMPDILRYMLCVIFLYCGFMLCGWLVLGPYHYKFQTLSRTSECLFSLINGDDMFATFQMVSDDANLAIWLFAQVYLYTFITLFIYTVLSLFIAVIMESYELIKEYYAHGFPKSVLMEFIAQCKDGASSSLYKHDMDNVRNWKSCLNCIRCRSEITDDSYEEIIGASDY